MNLETRATDDPRVKIAEEDALLLQEWLLLIVRGIDQDDDHLLLAGLLGSSMRSYRHLQRGWQSDASYAAWACRSLFDLHVLTRFVLSSDDNRRRFLYHWISRTEQPAEPARTVEPPASAKPGNEDNEVLLDRLWARIQHSAAATGTEFNTVILAHRLGMGHAAENMQRLCASLVCPSASWILSFDLERQSVRDSLLLQGSIFLSGVVADAGPLARSLCLTKPAAPAPRFFVLPSWHSDREPVRKEPHGKPEEVRRYGGSA